MMAIKPLRSTARVLLAVLVALVATLVDAREPMTTAGTEFIFSVQPNYTGSPALNLFIASDKPGQGVVEVPGLGYSKAFTLQAGKTTTVSVPGATANLPNGMSNLGVHVTADTPVRVYGLNQITYSTDAFMALPLPVLDRDYFVMSYVGSPYPSQLTIVGTQDGTEVTISPRVRLTGQSATPQPFTITLNKFQTYYLTGYGSNDVTGTKITSNAPVAVSGGVKCANVPTSYGYCDFIDEMMPPVSTWGQSFVTYPLATRKKGDMFRILASKDGTEVRIDGGLVATLGAGAYFEKIATAAMKIETSAPALVAQYSLGQGYDGVVSDPFMMLIPPSEQFLDSYIFSTPASGFSAHFVNVVVPSAAVGGVTLDGVIVNQSLFHPIGDSGLSGAQVSIAAGSHSIAASERFGIYVYGFGSYDSYGYPGGMSVEAINPVRGDYRKVRVISTISKNGLELTPTSFAVEPYSVTDLADRVEIEWRIPSFYIGQMQDLDYEVVLKNPIQSEKRLVSQRLEVVYEDVNGVEHRRRLGEQYVSVLPSAYTIALALDKGAYSVGESAAVSAGVANLGASNAPLSIEFDVRDEQGNLVKRLSPVSGLVVAPGGQADAVPNPMETTGMYAGNYRLQGHLLDANGSEVATATADFRVDVPSGMGLSASLFTDKQVYEPWAQVKLVGRVVNNAPNAIQSPTTAVLSVMRSDGTPVYTGTSPVGELFPAGSADLSFLAWLVDEKAGPFTALLTVYGTNGVMLTSAATGFQVERLPIAGLVGYVDVAQPVVYRGDANLCTETLTNFGAGELADVTVRHRLVALESGQVLDDKASVRSVTGYGRQTDAWSIATQGMAVGEYGCVLSVTAAGTSKDLAMAGFTVKEPPIKIGAAWQSGTKGRLLVLLDKNADDHQCGHHSVRLHGEHGLRLGKGARAEVRLVDGTGAQLVYAKAANDERWSSALGDDRLKIVAFDKGGITIDVDAAENEAVEATVVDEGNTLRLATGPLHHECDHDHEHGERFRDFTVVGGKIAADAHLPPPPSLMQQRAMLEAMLKGEGWAYTIVDDGEAFADAFHHGGYSAYLLLSERAKLSEDVQRELIEAVNRGEGLLVAGEHDHRHNRLDPALGVEFRGHHENASGLTVAGADWLTAGEAPFVAATHATEIRPAGATVIGRYTGVGREDDHDHQRQEGGNSQCAPIHSDAAVTSFSYGKGRSVYAGFDLLAQATGAGDTSLFAGLLRAATAQVHPDQVPMAGGVAIPLAFHLENQGMAVSGRVVATLPAGTQVVDAGTGTVQPDGTVIWTYELAVGQTLDLPLLAIYPAGTQAIAAVVQTLSGGNYADYATVDHTLSLTAAPAWENVLAAADALAAPKRGSEGYRQCAHELGKAKSAFDRKDYRDSLEHLIRAADPLKDKSAADAVNLRLGIDDLLREVGAKAP